MSAKSAKLSVSMQYEHRTSTRSRSVRLKVTSDGQVIVTSPPRTPLRIIEAFVTQHRSWIEAALAKSEQHPAPIQTEKALLFGEWYEIVVNRQLDAEVGVSLQGKQLVVVPANLAASQATITNTIERFLKTTAEKYIVPRTHQWATVMDISFAAISLREQKTRWGSCSSRGNLQFNWRLVHYKPEVIDYVIIHELAHRRQMNHSRAFWDVVRQFDPEYQLHRGWLKRHGWNEG